MPLQFAQKTNIWMFLFVYTDGNDDNKRNNSFNSKLFHKFLTVYIFFPLCWLVKAKGVSTNLTRVLNPKVNMAVQFNVACEAIGYKITDIRVQISNKTTDCEREPQLCGGKNLAKILQFLFIIVLY